MNSYFEKAQESTIAGLSGGGPILVIAPHQDDESLGCGGTIAMATKAGIEVFVIFVTDGSGSHPHSKEYPHDRLVQLREDEAHKALALLGVKPANILFMRLSDGELPFLADPGFEDAVSGIMKLIVSIQPAVVYMPWRRDPHRDHRATWEITASAIHNSGIMPRIYEYFIWLFERAGSDDMPEKEEGELYSVDITATLELKKSAILAHVSQTTGLIDDDESGFRLSDGMLNHFSHPKEYFIQTNI